MKTDKEVCASFAREIYRWAISYVNEHRDEYVVWEQQNKEEMEKANGTKIDNCTED